VPAAPKAGAVAPGHPPEAAAVLRGRRVLLVEDNELNQLVGSELLRDVAGMSVTLAKDGQVAVDLLQEKDFDIVLMDLQMPVLDGFGATARIRADVRFASLPIIAVTAHALASDHAKCLAAGMNDHVSKPFEPRELFAKLAEWLPPAAETPSASTPAAARFDGETGRHVSYAQGLAMCMGRQGLYERARRQFVRDRADDATQIRAALARDDSIDASRLAHQLVSSSGAIGAAALSALARQLQQTLDQGGLVDADGLLERLAAEHAAVCAELMTDDSAASPSASSL
jgi:two-component system sensor histidine kinase/response regulator